MIEVWIDGACEPKNPGGNMGWGYYIELDGKFLHSGTGFKPAMSENTNNVAEYQALLDAMIWLYQNGHNEKKIDFYGDSKLVINQMNYEWGIKGGAYAPLAYRCRKALAFFKQASFEWIPREENEKADELSKEMFTKRNVQVTDRSKFKS